MTMWFSIAVLSTEEKYNEAIYSSAKRLVAAIDGLPDPGGPKANENKRESNFKSREETDEKRGQFTLVVGGFDKTWWHTVVQMFVMFSTRTLQPEDKYIFLVYAHGRCVRTMVSSYYHSIISLSRYYSKMKPATSSFYS
ncbi:hypothetical protein OIU84_006685 [Salix udensis]|uniref:Uncharacterized protein n=1 Tax=Salix udensis TaxID=889485 RepID=A0AAD6K184_9ROSI|nr:hypothetical protein OIU84_006685 [Salix udensis]